MMTLAQKWLLGLLALGGLGMVLSNPKAFATGADALRKLTAGSVTEIATQGKAGTK